MKNRDEAGKGSTGQEQGIRHTSWKRRGSIGHAKGRWNRKHRDGKTWAVGLVVQVVTDSACCEIVRRQPEDVDDKH